MRILFVFILGIAIGAAALYYYEQRPRTLSERVADASGSARDGAQRAADKTRAAASDFSDTFNQKLRDWHLTSNDIHTDLARGKEIARENAARAREKVSDVRIVAVIKAKYVLDRDLSANAISVESHDGSVTLSGNVASEALVGRAVALALDTDGVQHVTARLKTGS